MEELEGAVVQLGAGKAWRWAEVRSLALGKFEGEERGGGRKGRSSSSTLVPDPDLDLSFSLLPPDHLRLLSHHEVSSPLDSIDLHQASYQHHSLPWILPSRDPRSHRRPLRREDDGHLRSVEPRMLEHLRSEASQVGGHR